MPLNAEALMNILAPGRIDKEVSELINLPILTTMYKKG